MLNAEREQNYRVQHGQWKLPCPDGDVLTGPQRRRLQHKRQAHTHYPDEMCLRCRPRPRGADPLWTPGPARSAHGAGREA